MEFKPGHIYYIEWNDHWSNSGGAWGSYRDTLEPIVIKSVGWCIVSNDEVVRLAGHVNPETGDFSGEINIMIPSIKAAWELTNI